MPGEGLQCQGGGSVLAERVVGSAVRWFAGTGRVLAATVFCEDEDATGTGAMRPPPLPFHRLHKARHSPSCAFPASPFPRIF